MNFTKEIYQEPVADIISFATSDIITSSDPYGFDVNWDNYKIG